MADTKHDSEKLVRDFLGSWEDRDLEIICGSFADDAVYHNVPVAPITGIAGIRTIFQAFLDAFAEAKLDIVTLAAEPGLVLAERIDYFTMNDGRKVVLPVNGVFEVRDGKIVRFSDYFDLADFEQQSGFTL
ncbi:limonene-1,2-epoxide hydrolase family protein [Mycolicibacterium psychrotolerans]|uniref:limonene-1,2-epoxide hydrolase family protein n=1 Tax=Mycolicibacterium psychrotolerans TaxID=216929 RepID=UPI003D667E8F